MELVMKFFALCLLLPLLSIPGGETSWKYKEISVQGWEIYVEKALYEKNGLRDNVLALLRTELWEIRTRLPENVVKRLQKVKMRFHLDRAECPGGVYHPSADWLRNHNLPEDWAEGIEFGVARNFLGWSRMQPDMVLHELSHAWHHQVLGYDDARIQSIFQSTSDSGKLEDALFITGGRKRAYALSNPQEFFAEMSEAWWGANDFHPFVKGEIIEDYPEVAKLMGETWRMPKKKLGP